MTIVVPSGLADAMNFNALSGLLTVRAPAQIDTAGAA
jgi:hypothetical protein